MSKITRRAALAAGFAAAAGGGLYWWYNRKPPLGTTLDAGLLERGRSLVANSTVVDIHAHPGRFFLTGADPDSLLIKLMRDGYEAERIADMQAAQVTASLFAIVADLQVLGIKKGGLQTVRAFEPCEAWADFQRQLLRLQADIESGLMRLALTPADILAAKKDGWPVALLCCEGGDFIEDDVSRVADVYAEGLRSITLMHYNGNNLGDTQTGTVVHGGLTPTGHEMNRIGMLIDVAHASTKTCKDVIDTSTQPVMLSHSILEMPGAESPRLISLEHARLIADNGGVIGAWPAGIGSATLADYAAQIMALVDAVGVEHVAIGSDMDANYKPVLTEYADFPLLAAILLQRGLREEAVTAILGGNFMRLFSAVSNVSSSQARSNTP